MKKCPQCGRDYNDDSLSFCLDDGSELLFGPSDDPATAILTEPRTVSSEAEAPTRAQIHTTEAEAEPQRSSANRVAKPLAVSIITVAILVGGFFGYRYLFSHGSKQIESIAVMPFINESGNADVEYLSDGMTETLIGSLSQLPGLSVKARSSVFRYKGKEIDPKKVGVDLDVQALLNGRVVQRGDQLILNLELVDALTENVIWHATYNRKQADLVSLQTEIARDVSSKLKSKLSGADERKLSKTYTTNSDAYRLYLQGRFNWNKREEKEFRKAIEFFDRAIALDPNYALAYAGLADAYALLGTFGFLPSVEAIPRSREYALKAIAIDDTLAEPHTTLAYIMADYDYDFVAAENEFKRAIELNPDYATAHQWYAEVLTYSGRFDEAFAEFHRALELEPMSLPINWDYGRALYVSRRYDESIEQLKRTIEINPSFARGHRQIAMPYLMKGDYANSIESHARFFELVGRGRDATLLRSTFARDGWISVQRLLVSQDSPLSEGNNSWIRAKAAAALGDKETAFLELQKLHDNRISSFCWLKVEPQLDALRDDPRYTELLKKIRFAE